MSQLSARCTTCAPAGSRKNVRVPKSLLVSARRPELFWLYALLATLGSVIGAAGTFWIGKKAGDTVHVHIYERIG